MKRFVLAAACAAMATSAMAIELKMWAPSNFTPAAGLPAAAEAYKDLLARFEAENPDITIEWEVLAGGAEALQQILTASTAGTLPDFSAVDSFWVARVAETGKLQPLNDLWSEESRAAFYPRAIEAVTFDGKIYAAWFHNAWRGLFYKSSELKALGFDKAPATWAELQAVLAAAKAAGRNGAMLPGTSADSSTLHMLSVFWGLGGELVDDTGKPIFFEGDNRAKLEQTYQIYRDLVSEGYMPADVGTMSEVDLRPYFYANETFAMAQSSSSAAQLRADVPALKGDLGAFAMPLPGDGVSMPVMTGWTYGIFTDDPERKAAAWKFIEFTLRPDNLGALNAAAGLLPTMVSIWDHEAYRDDPLMQQFRGIFDTAGMRERPAVPIYPVLSTSWAEQLADVVAGNITPAQAVDNARDATMREYERLTSR